MFDEVMNRITNMITSVRNWVFLLLAGAVVFGFSFLFGQDITIPGYNDITPTATVVIMEPTETNTPMPTEEPTEEPTATEEPGGTIPEPTNTEEPTETATATETIMPTDTPEPTSTDVPTATEEPTEAPTVTSPLDPVDEVEEEGYPAPKN